MTKDDALEEIGQCVDTIENLSAALTMPLPPELHVKSIKESLPELQGRLKQAYFELGGEDVWVV